MALVLLTGCPRVADAADFCKNRGFSGALRVSVARRQTRIVYDAFMDLVGAGKSLVDTGDVATYMRDRDYPMDAWEIRGEFFQLRQMGLIDLDADSAQWFSVPGGDFDSARAASWAPMAPGRPYPMEAKPRFAT